MPDCDISPCIALGARMDGVSIPHLLRWVTGNWDPRSFHLRHSKAEGSFPSVFFKVKSLGASLFRGGEPPAACLAQEPSPPPPQMLQNPMGHPRCHPGHTGDGVGARNSRDHTQPGLSKGKESPLGAGEQEGIWATSPPRRVSRFPRNVGPRSAVGEAPLGSVTPARGERTPVPQRAQLQREQDVLRIPRGAGNRLSLYRSFFYLVLGSITPRGWGCQGWPLGCSPEPQELSTQPAGADSGGWHVVATRLE